MFFSFISFLFLFLFPFLFNHPRPTGWNRWHWRSPCAQGTPKVSQGAGGTSPQKILKWGLSINVILNHRCRLCHVELIWAVCRFLLFTVISRLCCTMSCPLPVFPYPSAARGGAKSLIFHVTLCIPICVIVGGLHVEAKSLWDPQGISSSNIIVSNRWSQSLVVQFFAWGSRGITLENHHRSSLCEVHVCGDKSDDTAFLSEHVIICTYLHCSAAMMLIGMTRGKGRHTRMCTPNCMGQPCMQSSCLSM